MRSVTNAGNMSVTELQNKMKAKLAILEVQVMRNTLAFLRWKNAWHPRLQLFVAPTPSSASFLLLLMSGHFIPIFILFGSC